jgi:crotonobetainyl-CoA:carnitine CoA-transferase CaiB-like acyl-CoA transferase
VTEGTGALAGLVVVDLSTTLPSAYTSMFFADYGAEVIQVEPFGGSRLRSQDAWPFWFRGKKSIELDYRDPDDLAVARRLAADADLVIEAFRPGVADRLGLGFESLSEENPGLVYTSITGFGPTGKYANVKSYEPIVMAKTGSMYGPNRSGRQGPVFMNVAGATMAGSLLAIQGSLVALHGRLRNGHGQKVDATMIQGMLSQDPWSYFGPVLARLYPEAFSGVGQAPSAPRPVPTSWLGFGLLNAYSADGRWMQFAHATQKQFAAFVDELGLGWTRSDPEWKGAPDSEDASLRERWWELMLEAARSKTVAEWQEVFDRNSNTFAEVYRDSMELFEHPQFVHDDNIAEVEVPGLGPVRQLGPLVKMSRTGGDASSPPPAPGQQSDQLRSRPRRAAARVEGTPTDRPALEGVLVIDLGTFYAGPFGSTMLTDQGARVIKVEPLAGDPIRYNMPIPEWASVRVTQGKESLAVDVFTAEGKAIVEELIRRADLVLHSYRGGVAKRMGLDQEAALALNPDLIYHHGQGYGLTGPYSRRQAYAPTIAAGSGFSRRSGGGGPEGVPLTIEEIKDQIGFLGGAQAGLADGFAALGVGAALALGLVARDLGRGGQSSMTTMLATMGHVMGDSVIDYPDKRGPLVTDPELWGFGALYRLYEAAEGWVVLCVTDDREWQALAAALDEVALGTDPRFESPELRAQNQEQLADLLSGVFTTRTAREWEDRMLEADVACVAVTPMLGGLASGLQSSGGLGEELGFMTTVVHPVFGEIPRTRRLFNLSRSQERLGASCTIGQHTDAILEELGYAAEDIAALRAKGVVG